MLRGKRFNIVSRVVKMIVLSRVHILVVFNVACKNAMLVFPGWYLIRLWNGIRMCGDRVLAKVLSFRFVRVTVQSLRPGHHQSLNSGTVVLCGISVSRE